MLIYFTNKNKSIFKVTQLPFVLYIINHMVHICHYFCQLLLTNNDHFLKVKIVITLRQ